MPEVCPVRHLQQDYTWVIPRRLAAELTKLREFMISQLVIQIIDRRRRHLSGSLQKSKKQIGARLSLGLNRSQLKIYCRLCTSMRNAHRRSAVALGPENPGKTSQNLGNPTKTCQNWFLNCCYFLQVSCFLLQVSCTKPHRALSGALYRSDPYTIVTPTLFLCVANNCCFENRSNALMAL